MASFQTGITAAGSIQATATKLITNVYFNVVSTVGGSGSNGVILPPAQTGQQVIVCNQGGNPLNVYPQVGGIINVNAVNIALQMPIDATYTFFSTNGSNWATAPCSTYGAPSRPIIMGTVTQALSAAQSGSIVRIQSAAAACTYTLPTPAAGLYYEFFCTNGSLANAVTVTSTTALITGNINAGDASAVTGNPGGSAVTNVIMSTSSAVSDRLVFQCVDGSTWGVHGSIAVHTTVTSS